MKQLKSMKMLPLTVLTILLTMATVSNAAIQLQPVHVFETQPTTHIANQYSSLTTITMSWEYTGTEDVDGYYYKINSASSYTAAINDTNYNKTTNTTSNPANMADGSYYLHVAAYQEPTGVPPPPIVIGPLTTYGPLIIDTTKPEILDIVGPDNNTTFTSSIALDIGANEKISYVNISEGVPGDGPWKEFTPPADNISCAYELKQGENLYTLQIQVKDLAGNISDGNPYPLTFTSADNITMAQYTSVPTLSQWGIIFFITILISIGILFMRRDVFGREFM